VTGNELTKLNSTKAEMLHWHQFGEDVVETACDPLLGVQWFLGLLALVAFDVYCGALLQDVSNFRPLTPECLPNRAQFFVGGLGLALDALEFCPKQLRPVR
jgi:hypothetical protein